MLDLVTQTYFYMEKLKSTAKCASLMLTFERWIVDFIAYFKIAFHNYDISYEPPRGKTNNVLSEQVQHKPACTSTEKSYKLEILD